MPSLLTALPGSVRIFLALATAALLILILERGQVVLVPVALAVMFSFILTPPVRTLERVSVPRFVAAGIVLIVALGLVGGFGYLLSRQFSDFAAHMPQYTIAIKSKLATLRETRKGTLGQIQDTVEKVSSELDRQDQKGQPTAHDPKGAASPVAVQSVSVVPTQPNDVESLRLLLEPVLSPVITAGIVLILTAFMLVGREDLRNRLIRLVGSGRMTVTTRTLDEAGDRISKFLFSQSLINGAFGVCIAVGLLVIGVPYALLWGVCAAVLRFVPYLGSALALVMPAALAFVSSLGWAPTVETVILFLALDGITANVVEPILIGTRTGISSLALLISAMFWTWLWGPIGLLLSTPLTVCLAAIGKHVPEMEFLSVVLGDEPPLEVSATFYQRLLAGDEAEATEIIDHEVSGQQRPTVFDDTVVPTLVRAGRDRVRGDISAEEEEFVVRTIRDMVNHHLEVPNSPEQSDASPAPRRVLGVPARNESDEVGLKMLSQLLGPGWTIEQLTTATLASEMLAAITRIKPDVLCISSLPPGGLSHARYLCKRIHNQFPTLPIWLLRPDPDASADKTAEQLAGDGAQQVATSFAVAATQLNRFVFESAEASLGNNGTGAGQNQG